MRLFRYDKSVVVEKILTGSNTRVMLKIKVDFKLIQPDNFPDFAKKFKEFEIDAEKLLQSGDMCIIAEANGRIISCVWVALNENYVMEMEKYIRMPDSNSAYLYAVYTVPEYRGFGVAAKAIEKLLVHLKKKGVRKVYALIHPNNFSSLRCFQKVGFKRIGMVHFVRILKLKIYVCKGLTRRDHKIITEMLSNERDKSIFLLIF